MSEPNYDAYEIHPCCAIEPPDGCEKEPDMEYVETCDEDHPNIVCWSLYGHLPGTGIQCIGDYATRGEAEHMWSKLTHKECLFAEDDDGKGALISEIIDANGWPRRVWPLHMTPQVVSYLIRKGYKGLFLEFRGAFDVDDKLFR
jgi:hypothetical protein